MSLGEFVKSSQISKAFSCILMSYRSLYRTTNRDVWGRPQYLVAAVDGEKYCHGHAGCHVIG